jgi:hypothetical protein
MLMMTVNMTSQSWKWWMKYGASFFFLFFFENTATPCVAAASTNDDDWCWTHKCCAVKPFAVWLLVSRLPPLCHRNSGEETPDGINMVQ